jgi:hypothetical protein
MQLEELDLIEWKRPAHRARVERTKRRSPSGTHYHHLGPGGLPRNVSAMGDEKLRHLAGHPRSTDELRRMTRKELRERGIRPPAVRMTEAGLMQMMRSAHEIGYADEHVGAMESELRHHRASGLKETHPRIRAIKRSIRAAKATSMGSWEPQQIFEARWSGAPYYGVESFGKGDRKDYSDVIRHHRRQAGKHERAMHKAVTDERRHHHREMAAHHRMRAKQYSRDLRHAQVLQMPGARDSEHVFGEAAGRREKFKAGSSVSHRRYRFRHGVVRDNSEGNRIVVDWNDGTRSGVHSRDLREMVGRRLKEADLEEAFTEGCRLEEAGGGTEASYRAKAMSYAGKHGGIGSSEREDIGKGKGRKYPPGFQHLRNALIRQGKSVAVASMIAYGALRRWAEGRGKVKPSTRDKARKVLGQLDAGKGKNTARAAASR